MASNDYSFFHSSAWAKVLVKSYGYSPLYFCLMDRDRLIGLIPIMGIHSWLTGRRGVSLPFSDYCEPIGTDADLRVILDHIIEYGRKAGWKHIELRGWRTMLTGEPASANYLGHKINLVGDGEDLMDRFRSNTRWSIRKAIAEKVEVSFDSSLNGLKEFYRLHALTRQRHDAPPQPFGFFKNIHDHIFTPGLGHVVLAKHEDTVVAGAVCFHFGEKAMYKYSASDFGKRQLCPNNLVLFEAIKNYSERGLKEFCLGRSDCSNEGLLRFKTGWNTEERTINYYRYDLEKMRFIESDKIGPARHANFFSKVPLPILNLVGRIAYKHMG